MTDARAARGARTRHRVVQCELDTPSIPMSRLRPARPSAFGDRCPLDCNRLALLASRIRRRVLIGS